MSVTRDVLNPATEAVIATVEAVDTAAVDRAVARAHQAQLQWAAVPPAQRAARLRDFAAAVDRARGDLAEVESANGGHLRNVAAGGVDALHDFLLYSAGGVERLNGEQIPVADGINITFHEPIGVVAVVVPWNFPLVITAWALAPALAAGNAVIIKPAELTPLSALRLQQVAIEAGLPDGLVQVTPGSGRVIGEHLVTHPGVGHVVFTGSTSVGKRIMELASRNVTGVTLELGGKSANIIFADADLEAAAAGVPGAAFDNAGQDCCARSRILVQRSVFDLFMSHLEPIITKLRVGDPQNPDSQIGPLISAAQRDNVAGYVDGEDIAFQGSAPTGPGFWFPPTVLAPISTESVAWREEIFGPVVAVVPFDDEYDAVRIANDTAYGLSGSIWTNDLRRGLRMARAVQGGNLSVNSNSSVRYSTPFGGMKQSGLGRELGPHALHHFTETKNVYISTV
jgi:acyl-CoA reductase-like NAD-dependent aldehyde dehydrogenase